MIVRRVRPRIGVDPSGGARQSRRRTRGPRRSRRQPQATNTRPQRGTCPRRPSARATAVATRRSTIPAPAAQPEPATATSSDPSAQSCATSTTPADRAVRPRVASHGRPAPASRLRVKRHYSLPGEASASTAPSHTLALDEPHVSGLARERRSLRPGGAEASGDAPAALADRLDGGSQAGSRWGRNGSLSGGWPCSIWRPRSISAFISAPMRIARPLV